LSQILIRRGIEVESGEIGAFCLGEECFVKVLKIYGGTPVLRSLNLSYEDIEVTEEDEFFTIGKVIECKIKF
jgi:SOS-response transcriptional repressor LexA